MPFKFNPFTGLLDYSSKGQDGAAGAPGADGVSPLALMSYRDFIAHGRLVAGESGSGVTFDVSGMVLTGNNSGFDFNLSTFPELELNTDYILRFYIESYSGDCELFIGINSPYAPYQTPTQLAAAVGGYVDVACFSGNATGFVSAYLVNGTTGSVTISKIELRGPGPAGIGLSAYQVAVLKGFVGSEASWLSSLVGPAGSPGADGAAGAPGAAGATGPQGPAGVDATYVHPRAGLRIIETWPASTAAGSNGWTSFTNSGIIGGNASSGSTTRFGLVRLDTSVSAISAPTLTLGSGTTFVFGGLKHRLEFSLNISNLSTASEEYIERHGYHNSVSSALPTNGVFFEYDRTQSLNWRLVARQGGTQTVTTSSVPVAAGWKEMKIEVNATSTSAEYFIDGVSIGTVTSNIPSGTSQLVSPTFQKIKTVGTTARVSYLDWAVVEAGTAAQ